MPSDQLAVLLSVRAAIETRVSLLSFAILVSNTGYPGQSDHSPFTRVPLS